MPPTIHLVRHAQGFHNVAKFGEGIHDPLLTDEGVEQAKELCRNFPDHDNIDLLMASPMKRTIQTCQLAFAPAVARGHKILLMPLAQESSDALMDTGSSESSIRETFGDLVDTSRLELFPYWHTNSGRFSVEGPSVVQRAQLLRQTLRERPEKHIALVSHGSFAHYVVGNVSGDGEEQTSRMWSNTEWRTFEFAGEGDEEAQLVETEESVKRRPDLEEQENGYVLSVDGPRKDGEGNVMAN